MCISLLLKEEITQQINPCAPFYFPPLPSLPPLLPSIVKDKWENIEIKIEINSQQQEQPESGLGHATKLVIR